MNTATSTLQVQDDTTQSIEPCSLVNLKKNQPAIITDIIDNKRFGSLDSMVSRRLKDLGFLPNTPIRVVAKGLFGKAPYVVQLGTGSQFSLRADELAKICCRLLDNAH